MGDVKHNANPDAGTKKIRQYMLNLHGGGFWEWKISKMDDAELAEAYEEHMKSIRQASPNSKEHE